jgi:hypothetical protein
MTATTPPLRIFVGWDSREDIAYQVCRASLLRHASRALEIVPLKQDELRADGLYSRPLDPLASTEFTYTRFLVPHLAGYQGWALFCDCDFLWTRDVAELFALADEQAALLCVQHDHRPNEATKMDGRQQTVYPRKNWSSLMLINCGHPANATLTVDEANTRTGSYLHRFQWLSDDLIGGVPATWNWLEGWNEKPADAPPAAIHFTRGGPWFADWQDVDYGGLWTEQARSLGWTGPV